MSCELSAWGKNDVSPPPTWPGGAMGSRESLLQITQYGEMASASQVGCLLQKRTCCSTLCLFEQGQIRLGSGGRAPWELSALSPPGMVRMCECPVIQVDTGRRKGQL